MGRSRAPRLSALHATLTRPTTWERSGRVAQIAIPSGLAAATFNLRHTFPVDHGERGPSSCRTCHPGSVKTYTCYGCHEHTFAETIAEHAGEVSGDISTASVPSNRQEEEEGNGKAGAIDAKRGKPV